MHKNRLQELCHRRKWNLPVYTSSRDGPDHNPRFGASVIVNGLTFDAPSLYKFVKEAHNMAAEVALDSLCAIVDASITPPPQAANEEQISHKSRLQNYVQKRNISVLRYDSVCEGSAHMLRFKAWVTVDEQTFESSQYFRTLREAEHDAAKVALMSLPMEENHQDEPNFYKNLLQQLVQKEGLPLPVYNTLHDGAFHMPIFICTVVVDGERFIGDGAKTKKQAEMNAAKVAWSHFKDRKNSCTVKAAPGEIFHNQEQLNLHPVQESLVETEKYHTVEDISTIGQPDVKPFPLSAFRIDEPAQAKGKGNAQDDGSSNLENTCFEVLGSASAIASKADEHISVLKLDSDEVAAASCTNNSPISIESPHEILSSGHSDQLEQNSMPKLEGVTEQEEGKSVELPEDLHSATAKDTGVDALNTTDAAVLLCNRVRVYPRKPDFVLPAGATLLPFSDSAWVAVCFDCS